VTRYLDIVKLIKENFGVPMGVKITPEILFIKVHGIDDESLAKYINDHFKELEIKTKSYSRHKIYNNWIEIKNVDNKLSS